MRNIIPTKKYEFAQSAKEDNHSEIESQEDHDQYVVTARKEREQRDKKTQQKLNEKIERLRQKDFSETPFLNAEELAKYLQRRSFLEQKVIIELGIQNHQLDLKGLVSLYDKGFEGQTKIAVVENFPMLAAESSEGDKEKIIDFLSKIEFNAEDYLLFRQDISGLDENTLDSEYLSKYFAYSHDADKNWSIFHGAKISSLLECGREGADKVFEFFEAMIENGDEFSYEELLFCKFLLEKLKETDNKKTAEVLIKKLAEENDFTFNAYPYFLEFLEKSDQKGTQNLLLEFLVKENDKEKMKRIILVAASVLGAEKLRDGLNACIIENRIKKKDSHNLEYVLSFVTPYLKPSKKGEKPEEVEADEKDEKKVQHILDLQQFYQQNIRFEEYKVNEKMNEREVELLKSLIGEDQKVLEMGCGTGRLTKELASDGYDVSGYDFTLRHVEITKSEIEKSGREAKVFQGDWHNNAIKNESLDVVYSLGRNILHDYSIVDQAQLFREANRILQKGGQFIFDIPNREKGGYKKMVDGYAEEMKKRGIRNFRYGTIYDSPDNINFATRYAYSHEDIEELARLTGFRISKVEKRTLETGAEDENWYYVLEKV